MEEFLKIYFKNIISSIVEELLIPLTPIMDYSDCKLLPVWIKEIKLLN
tara:strand:+ start:1068 stop:1211 length:144 start_codon:yes stop_codon:yes gene_type:complete